MYQRILVPLDGSELAEQVLPYVRILGKGLGARIELLRVFDHVPPSLADPAHRMYLDQVVLSVRNEAKDYLEGVAASLEKDGLAASCTVHEGDHASHVASYIVSEGEREPATLVAMSTHGRSGISRWLLGSVADKVLHATTSPLFLVRPRQHENVTPEVRLKTVIVPLDGSAFGEQVLPHVVALADALRQRVILIRVAPPAWGYRALQEGLLQAPLAPIEDPPTLAEPGAREYLNGVSAKLRQWGVSSVEVCSPRGVPADAILDAAERVQDSFVAMTTHGRSGIGRWLLGSVADRVVRYCPAPVLVVRASENG
jgi:nucleotide-binding universal stress UspA family protein